LWYGQSCLHNGKEAEGLDALKTAAEQSSDPATLATVASALATSGKDLDLATNTAKSAVMLVEQQTGSLSLHDITNTQMKKNDRPRPELEQHELDRAQDRRYRSGRKICARRLDSRPGPSRQDRLAQIYDKQGKPSQALDTDKLAKARAYPAVPGIDDRIGALENHLGHPSSIGDNGTTRLQDMRIVHLARIKPVSASGDFLVLFAAGKVSEVKMLNGDPAIEPYADLLK
jgi:hypothetical protein